MPDRTPPPLVALDGNGQATILSYNVPEPISYSAANYIEIPLPADAFAEVVVGPSAVPNPAGLVSPFGDAGMPHAANPPALVAPPAVVPTDESANAGAPAVAFATEPITERLAALTAGDVAALAAAGNQVVVHRSVSGQLDFRVLPAPVAQASLTPMMMKRPRDDAGGGDDDGGDGGVVTQPPQLSLTIDGPLAGITLHGASGGVVVSVTGSYIVRWTVGSPRITAVLNGQAAGDGQAAGGRFTIPVTVATAGVHTVVVNGTADPRHREEGPATASAQVTFAVALDQGQGDPSILPTVRIVEPAGRTILVDPNGITTVTVKGTTSSEGGPPVKAVTVTDTATGAAIDATPGQPGDWSNWSTQLLLEGEGPHRLVANCVNDKDTRATPAAITVDLLAQQPMRRLKNRLLVKETLTLSAFLGAYGAGRVIKTFTLLPGEKTTISVKTFTKTEEERKTASSILDSNATEAASDFEDAVSREQTSREALTESSNYTIGGSASASWGWGRAEVHGNFSGAANASREEAVKNVTNATRKHALKASTNRSVTINSDYQVSSEAGQEESTTREIANINVSRTLNFVFRQMNQQHITLIHLTDVRVAHYTEDLRLNAEGSPVRRPDGSLDIVPGYNEVPLPDLGRLLSSAISQPYRQLVRDTVVNVLSGIPDHQDTLRTVVETAVPKDAQDNPVPAAAYLRMPRNLRSTYTDSQSQQKLTVPGIILAHDEIVMRTDGVIVDAILGQGEGLDAFAGGMQEATIEERKLDNAGRQQRLDLVETPDEAKLNAWGRTHPLPPPAALSVSVDTDHAPSS